MKMNATSNAANPKNSRKRKRNGVRPPVGVEEPKGGGLTLEVLRVRVTLEDEVPQPPPLVEEEHPTRHLRVSRGVRNGQPTPPPALVAPTGAARTPRSAASIGTLSACRLLGLRSSSLKKDRGAVPRIRIWFSGSR